MTFSCDNGLSGCNWFANPPPFLEKSGATTALIPSAPSLPMIVTPCGRGIHRREIVGLAKLKQLLPQKWYGFSNLEIAVGPGKGREIDVVIVAEDRIFLVDLKDWNGRIETDNGHWLQNGTDVSPVSKIIQNTGMFTHFSPSI